MPAYSGLVAVPQNWVRAALSRYSLTFAFDSWLGPRLGSQPGGVERRGAGACTVSVAFGFFVGDGDRLGGAEDATTGAAGVSVGDGAVEAATVIVPASLAPLAAGFRSTPLARVA